MPIELSPNYHVIIVCCDDFYAESVASRLKGKKGIKTITLLDNISAIDKHAKSESTLFIIYDKTPGYEKLSCLEKYCNEELRWNVLLVTESKNPIYIAGIMQSKLNGCLLKSNGFDDIAFGIKHMMKGLKYYSWQFMRAIADIKSARPKYLDTFTNREPETFELMCKRKKVKEMAEIMALSENTVKGYRSDVKKKVVVAGFAGIDDCGRHFGLIDE